ncbi:MAG TPA: hypothetical protein VM618_07515 [Acidimicrobiia bacterium]|nr:hypothetical protein [Acidimicrobiia bacterium]
MVGFVGGVLIGASALGGLAWATRSEPALAGEPASAPRPATSAETTPTPLSCPSLPADPVAAAEHVVAAAPDGWLAGDLTNSVDLPDGRRLWMFGDTFFGSLDTTGAMAPGWRMDRNSALVEGDGCVDLAPRHGRQGWITAPDAGHHLWPGDGWAHDRDVTVFLHDLATTGGGPLSFRPAGMQIATLTLPDLRLASLVPSPYDDPDRTWGSSVVESGSWTYLFAWTHGGPGTYVARTTADDVAQRWQFWTGGQWEWDALDDAVPVIEYGRFNNVAVSALPDGRLLAVAKDHEMLGSDVLAWVADRPEGPWTALGTVAPAPSDGGWTYMASVHNGGPTGTPVLAYNVNTPDLADLTSGRVRYGARFRPLHLPR